MNELHATYLREDLNDEEDRIDPAGTYRCNDDRVRSVDETFEMEAPDNDRKENDLKSLSRSKVEGSESLVSY